MGKAATERALERPAKADFFASKNHAIVLAARGHFLKEGFAGSSMDDIARSAGVSVKTIYSHFANKHELFSKVMVGACSDSLFVGDLPPEDALAQRFRWFSRATQGGLFGAGKEYLGHLLSDDQLALYRAVTRDADRFPELGRQYEKKIARGRTGVLIAYLESVARKRGWPERNLAQDAAAYEGLLRATIFEQALHGLLRANPNIVEAHALSASRTMWRLLMYSYE
jgi:AcrR family transcriptional regulator